MSVLATEYPGPMAILREAAGRPTARAPRQASRTTTPVPVGPHTVVADPVRRVGLRLTRRGRGVVIALAVVVGTVVTLASQQAVAGQGGGAIAVDTRTVVVGETLWQIAGEYSEPGQDVREVVDELMDLNSLATSDLRAGQELLVPAP